MTQPAVSTCLWYDNQAAEAAGLYCSLFDDARIISEHPQRNAEGNVIGTFLIEFELQGQRYTGLNGGLHYKLSPAASIAVHVDSQAEIDRLWCALLANGGVESRCGWLTDRFGLSWQIVPRALPRLLASEDAAAASRVMQAMMAMIKLDIAALEAVARG